MSNLRVNPSTIYTICVNCKSLAKRGLLEKGREIIPVTERSFLFITDYNRPYYWYEDEEQKIKRKGYQQSGPISLCERCSLQLSTINCSQLVKDYLVDAHKLLGTESVKIFDQWFFRINPPYMLDEDPAIVIKLYSIYNEIFEHFKSKGPIIKELYDNWFVYNIHSVKTMTHQDLYKSYILYIKNIDS